MTDAEIYEAAADLLEKPGAWTQGSYARTADGQPVCPTSVTAHCFCMVGAVARTRGESPSAAERWLDANAAAIGRMTEGSLASDLAYWNDRLSRTQAEVVSALRKAAELARAGQ